MAENRMRGQIRIATDIETRGGGVARGAGSIASDGFAEAFGQLGREMAGISKEVGQLADRAARFEGGMAGRQAGLDPEFRPQNQPTIYGEAYDAAGLQIAETRLRTEINGSFEKAYEQHGSNPTKLQGVLAASSKGFLESMSPELRERLGPELALSMQGATQTLMRRAAREQVARIRAEQSAALETGIAEQLKVIHQRAYAGGLDAEADKALALEIASLGRMLNRAGPDGKPLVAPAQRERLLLQAKEEVVISRMTGAFERAPSIEAKRQMIEALDQDYRESKGLGGLLPRDRFLALRRTLDSALRQDMAEINTQRRALGKELEGVVKLAEKGFAPPPGQVERLTALAAKDPELGPVIELANRQLEHFWHLRGMNEAELDSYARGERARLGRDGASAFEVARVETAEKLLANMRSGLEKDQLEWAERAGRVRQVVPIDPSSPEALATTMRARIAQGDEIGRIYGRPPQYLRPQEATTIAQMLAKGGAPMVQAAQQLAAAAGDRAPDVFAEVAKKGNAPAMAYFGRLVTGTEATPFVMDAANGIALKAALGEKPLPVKLPSPDDQMRLARSVHDGALDDNIPTVRAAVDLANAAYAVRAQRAGKADRTDEAIWKQTLREALGERKIGGKAYGGIGYSQPGYAWSSGPVIVPPNVRQDGFKDLIDAIRLEDFGDVRPYHRVATQPALGDVEAGKAKAGFEMQPAGLVDLRRATLRNVDSGVYQVVMRQDENGVELLVDKNGRPFEIDLNRLEPVLRKRRPDLYDGAR